MSGIAIVVLATICGIATVKWFQRLDAQPRTTTSTVAHQTVGHYWFASTRGVKKHLHEIRVNGMFITDPYHVVNTGDVIEYRGKRLEVK